MRAAYAFTTALLLLVVGIGIAAVLGCLPPSQLSTGAPTSGEVEVATAVPLPDPLPTVDLPPSILRSSDSAEGRVAVAWLNPDYLRSQPEAAQGLDSKLCLLFRVLVAERGFKLSVWDLRGMIFLRDGSSMEYGSPTWIPAGDGAWKAGLAAFPNQNARGNPVPALSSRYLEIVIRGLPGPKERTLRWDLLR